MNVIYIKLGVGISNFSNARLGLIMDTVKHPAAAVNYDDMDSDMAESLNLLIIIQIPEEEYYSILAAVAPPEIVQVSTSYLLTLSNYIAGCPSPGDAFFILRAGEFFKISWATIKSCIGSNPHEIFRVGDPGKPNVGDTEYTNNMFEWDVIILVNSLKIYEASRYDPADLPFIDHYIHDKVAKKITRPATFGPKELIDITVTTNS